MRNYHSKQFFQWNFNDIMTLHTFDMIKVPTWSWLRGFLVISLYWPILVWFSLCSSLLRPKTRGKFAILAYVLLNCNLFSITLLPDAALILQKNVTLYRITDRWWLDQTVKKLIIIAFRSRKFIACHSNPSVLNNASVLWCAKKSRMRVLMSSGNYETTDPWKICNFVRKAE